MRRLSDATWALINKLHARPSLFERVTGKQARLSQVVREIGRSHEPAAIPHLTHLFSSSNELSAASEAVHHLFQATPPEDLPWLDEEIRSWSHQPGNEWSRLRPEEVRAASFPSEFRVSVLGLISAHPNGRVREEAVKRLGETANPESLRFLLVRLNDWVANVRDAARPIVEKWLAEGSFSAFLPSLFLVSRLAECQRADYTELINAVAERLVRPEHLDFLLSLIEQGYRNRKVARHWFAKVLALPGIDQRQPLKAGLRSDDVVVRLQAAKAASTVFQGDELASVLAEMRADAFAALRIEALSAYVAHFPESALRVLQGSLLDRSASVREHARYHLRKIGDFDFASAYRDAMRDDTRLRTALRGLGETGGEADVALILPYLKSPTTAIRSAAVQALSGLAGDQFVETFLDCLRDDSPRVVRTAGKWLSQRVHLLDLDQIAALFVTDNPAHVRHTVLAIFDHVDFWKALPHLILAVKDDEESIRLRARALIEKRCNHVFTRPSDQQADRIGRALREDVSRRDHNFLLNVRQWLTGLGIPGM